MEAVQFYNFAIKLEREVYTIDYRYCDHRHFLTDHADNLHHEICQGITGEQQTKRAAQDDSRERYSSSSADQLDPANECGGRKST